MKIDIISNAINFNTCISMIKDTIVPRDFVLCTSQEFFFFKQFILMIHIIFDTSKTEHYISLSQPNNPKQERKHTSIIFTISERNYRETIICYCCHCAIFVVYFCRGGESVVARHSNHNGMPAIIFKSKFKSKDYYGITAEECRYTIVGRFLKPRPAPKSIELGQSSRKQFRLNVIAKLVCMITTMFSWILLLMRISNWFGSKELQKLMGCKCGYKNGLLISSRKRIFQFSLCGSCSRDSHIICFHDSM